MFVKSSDRSNTKISSKYVLVVRRVISAQPPFATMVDIRGNSLLKVLMDFFKDAAGMRLSENPPAIEPNVLYHATTEIMQRKREEEAVLPKENQDNNLIFELDAALTFLSEEFASERPRIDGLKQNGEITFDSLWAILPPNELLFTIDELSEPRVHRLLYSYVVQKPKDSLGGVYLAVYCNSVDYNGHVFGTTYPVVLKIDIFPGSKKIAELEVFPLQFHPKREEVRQRLIERGQKRIHIQNRRLNNYKGHGLIEKEVDNESDLTIRRSTLKKEKVNFHGRVIIDHAVYDQIVPTNQMIAKILVTIPKEALTEDQILTLPSTLYGFSLGDKTWGGFAVSRLSNVEWDDTVWESLVLPATKKSLIRTLVKSHVNNNSGFDDFVKEKGKGLIGLFTGPPGVGKTLTAEAVAEVVRRPLYMLSSGELGDHPGVMDDKLKQILELAHIWGAVLLIDEADVFLTKRDNTSLTRNAIVSIFLRQLEYYQGILFLTTNRKEHIDEAFKSRVHFCHHYDNLNDDARKKIWQGFLNQARANPRVTISIDEKGYTELFSMPLNGRQIKNTMKMAQFMATEEQTPITFQSINLVAESLQDFDF